MNKITQTQIVYAAYSFANQKVGKENVDGEKFSEFSDAFLKAVKWYRMAEIESIDDRSHPDNPNVSELTSSDTIKLHVDNWPEILEFLRANHPHRYDIYGDAITIFCDSKKHRKKLSAEIDEIRSIKDNDDLEQPVDESSSQSLKNYFERFATDRRLSNGGLFMFKYLYDEFVDFCPTGKLISKSLFRFGLSSWALANNMPLNPNGRMISKVDGVSMEFIYLQKSAE